MDDPGRGIDEGEDELTAAVRELAEETGLQVDPAQVRGRWPAAGCGTGSATWWSTSATRSTPSGCRPSRCRSPAHRGRAAHDPGHRWWTRAELAATDETVYPGGLADLLALAEQPDRWPVELPDVDESTAP